MRAIRRRCAIGLFALGLPLCLAACASGPSERGQQRQLRDLEEELADMKQQRDDLRVHYRTVDARNRVLIGLVKALNASAAEMAKGGAVVVPARERLEAIDRDLADLAGSLSKSSDEFAKLRDERASLNTQLDDAVKTIEEKRRREEQADARSQLFRGVLSRLRSIQSAAVQVHTENNRMLLRVLESVLFETGRAELVDSGKVLLDDIARLLADVPNRDLEIAGHTDGTPIKGARFASGWHLSASRAISVAQYLIGHGVPAQRIAAAGYSDTRPIQSRAVGRIEIVLLPTREELPDLTPLENDAPSTPAAAPAPKKNADASAPPAPADPNAPVLRVAPK